MPSVEMTRKKLIEFAKLERGWHYGEGVPADPTALASAFAILENIAARGFEEVNAFPGIEGEVRVTAYAGADYYEFTTELDSSVTYVCEREDEELENVGSLTVSEALKKLETRTPATCHSLLFVTSTLPNIMTPLNEDFRASHSETLEEKEFQWSRSVVRKKLAGISADTGSFFTKAQAVQGLPETQSSIGRYHLISLLNANSFRSVRSPETIATTTLSGGRRTILKRFLRRRH
ncbi:MAG: hypothetical protein ACREA2_20025 [Blastocatellia bacterium]